MPRLPSEQDLGPLPSLESRRGIATFDTAPLARGAAAIGEGIQKIGNAGLGIGLDMIERDRRQTGDLQEAEARSKYLIGKIDLDAQRGNETDPDALGGYHQRYRDNIANAASGIEDPERARKFRLGYDPEAEQGRVAAENRQFGLRQDKSLAELGDRSIALQNAAARAGSDADVQALGQAGQAEIRARLDAGMINEQQAAQMRRDLGDKLAGAYYQRLTPQQRIEALTPVQVGERTKTAYQFFTGRGWSPVAAAGIVGGLVHESGLKTGALNPGDGADGSDSIGLAQWNSDRAAALKQFAAAKGKDWRDYGTQLEFVDRELRSSEVGAAAKLNAATTPREAAAAFVTFERPQGWERGATSAHGWGNRLRQAEGVHAAYAGSTLPTIPGQGAADMLLPHQREGILRHAQAQADAEERQAQRAAHQDAQTYKARIGDELASIEASGQGLRGADGAPLLRTEDIAQRFGPQAARDFEADRARSASIHNALDGINALPEAEALQRLQRLQPRPGAEGFTADQQAYGRAAQQVDRMLSLRRTDPAKAVNDLPAVASVREAAQYETVEVDGKTVRRVQPASAQAIVRARLAAQDQLGISAPLAVMKGEADVIARGIHGAGDDPSKLRPVVAELRRVYGKDAERVLSDSLQLHGLNQDLAEEASRTLSKIGAGTRPNPFEQRSLDRAVGAQRLDDALAGRGAQPGSTAPQAPAGAPAPATPTPAPQPGRAAPAGDPPEFNRGPALEDLKGLLAHRDDPTVRQRFEGVYGRGTADRALAEADRRMGMGGRR